MNASEFRTELHKHINAHGEPYGSMWVSPSPTSGNLVEYRVLADPEGWQAGAIVHGTDGIEKLVLNIECYQGVTIATLVALPVDPMGAEHVCG